MDEALSVPNFLQTKTYSTNTAATSHAVAFDNSIRASGGAIGPSCLIAVISYDGTSGSQVSSITDSAGDTWAVGNDGTNDVRISNGSGVNGEMWYCYNATPGAHSLTINLSSSVKASIVIGEIDQVRPVTALDRVKGNINTTASTSRIGSNGTKGRGMLRVVIGGLAWNDASLTCTGVPVSYQGYVGIKDAGSNVGVGIECKATEAKSLASGTVVPRFNMSAGTTPVALMSLAFYRDGVVTGTDEDGYIDDIEGVATVTKTGTRWLYSSSTSAPYGGTGGSEKSQCFSFFPDYSSSLLSGVTIGDTIPLYYSTQPGGDDGTGYMQAYMRVFKNGELGDTLTADDEFHGAGVVHFLGTGLCTAGEYSVNLDKATEYNLSGTTAYAMAFEGDTGGLVSGTWAYLNDYSGNVPDYLVLSLTYPSASSIITRTLTGCGL